MHHASASDSAGLFARFEANYGNENIGPSFLAASFQSSASAPTSELSFGPPPNPLPHNSFASSGLGSELAPTVLRLKQQLTSKELEIIELRSNQMKLLAKSGSQHAETRVDQKEVEKNLRADIANLIVKMKNLHSKCNEKISKLNEKARKQVNHAEELRQQAVSELEQLTQQTKQLIQQTKNHQEIVEDLRCQLKQKEGSENALRHQVQCYLTELNLVEKRGQSDVATLQHKSNALGQENTQLRNLFMSEKKQRLKFQSVVLAREETMAQLTQRVEQLSADYTALLQEMQDREHQQRQKDETNKISLEKLHTNISRLTAHLSQKNTRLDMLEKENKLLLANEHNKSNSAQEHEGSRARERRQASDRELQERERESSHSILKADLLARDVEVTNLKRNLAALRTASVTERGDRGNNTSRDITSPSVADLSDSQAELRQSFQRASSEEVKDLYEQVIELTEQKGIAEEQAKTLKLEQNKTMQQLATQVAYINELQELNDKMYVENKKLQQKLRASKESPSSVAEDLVCVKDQLQHALRQSQMDKELAMHEQMERTEAWAKTLQEEKVKFKQLEEKSEGFRSKLELMDQARRETKNLVATVRADAKQLDVVRKARQQGRRPDVTMLISTPDAREYINAASSGWEGLTSLLHDTHNDISAFRAYIANSYTSDVSDECAMQ